MSGFITIHREFLKHPLVGIHNPDYCVAWLWMILQANWENGYREVDGKIINLERGQFVCSISYMVKGTGLSTKKIRTFHKKLVTEKMIAKTGKGTSVITICNYSLYQDEDTRGGKAGASEGQGRGKAGATRKQIKQIKQYIYTKKFEEFYEAYGYKKSKAQSLKIWQRKKLDDKAEQIIQAAHSIAKSRKQDPQFWKHPSTWLNQECWNDEEIPKINGAGGEISWNTRLEHGRKGGTWFYEWGPQPNKPDCDCPKELIKSSDGNWLSQI